MRFIPAGIAMPAIFIATIAASLGGCGRPAPSNASADSSRLRESQPATSAIAARAKSACPANGKWALCSIEKRLQRAGLVARRDSADTTMRAGFTVKPAAYALGRDSHVDIFIYRDEAALAADISKLDILRVAPTGKRGAWATPPTLIRSANLAAVLVTKDAREADRVALAITAGAPQQAR